MTPATQMRRALDEVVLRVLREAGFTGKHPHYRRIDSRSQTIDLVSFQTDKWGGGFLIELARCPAKNIRDWAGRRISSRRVTAQHFLERTRLPKAINRRGWYRYDQGDAEDRFEKIAMGVLAHLATKRVVLGGRKRGK